MGVFVITGAPGAPGITTTALGLSLTWPRDVLLIDADRQPTQSIQAGYLRGIQPGGRGLSALIRLHRETRPLAPELYTQSLPLTTEQDIDRRFLPGFARPGAVHLFDMVWPEFTAALAGLDSRGIDVVVDAGQAGTQGLPQSLLADADAVLFVTQTSLRALAATRLYLPLVAEQIDSLPAGKPFDAVLVGPGRPYSAREVSHQFSIPVISEIIWQPRHAAVLSDGEAEPKRFADTTLMHQFRLTATVLHERLQHTSLGLHWKGRRSA